MTRFSRILFPVDLSMQSRETAPFCSHHGSEIQLKAYRPCTRPRLSYYPLPAAANRTIGLAVNAQRRISLLGNSSACSVDWFTPNELYVNSPVSPRWGVKFTPAPPVKLQPVSSLDPVSWTGLATPTPTFIVNLDQVASCDHAMLEYNIRAAIIKIPRFIRIDQN